MRWERKRRGVMLVWVLASSTAVLILGGAAFFGLASAAQREAEAEREGEMALLAQEAIETVKYNYRFRAAAPVPSGIIIRNGKTYFVEVRKSIRMTEGAAMEHAACRVRLGGHVYAVGVFLGGAP